VLPLAVGVALSPIPIIAVILMLVTPRARVNGPAFVVGWLLGLALVGVVVLAIADPAGANDDGQPATWVDVVKLLLGLALLLLALRQWRGRPRGGEEAAEPKWMAAIDQFTPAKSVGMGVVLSAANPKNLLLAVVQPPRSRSSDSRADRRPSPRSSSPSSARSALQPRSSSTSRSAILPARSWTVSSPGWTGTTP
jgi:threonine/homoserine/homoserine lactone efflux protein